MFSRKKLPVSHQGKIIVKSVKQISREKNLTVWDITIDDEGAPIAAVWKDGPLVGEKETHEVSIIFGADRNSLEAENFTAVTLKIRKSIKWEFALEHTPFYTRVIAYRAKNDPRKNY